MSYIKSDLTQGSILGKLLHVAVPIMGTQLMQMAYNLTDMFWLGRLSAEAVAASGTAGFYLWMGMAFLIFGRMGAEIGVSQNKGRGDLATAKSYAQNAVLVAACMGLLYTIILVTLHNPLIAIFNIQEQGVVADAETYLTIVSLGILPAFVSASINGCFNGTGDSRTPFVVNAIGLVINIVLDPLFIFVFQWGVQGAALATILAQWIVCGLFVLAIKLKKNRPFERFEVLIRPKKEKILQIYRWSLPIALESGLFTTLAMLTARLVSDFGASAIAVQRVGSQIESLSWLIGGGFGSAVTTFMGQNFGAQRWSRIRTGFRISTVAMIVWGLAITIVLSLAGSVLYGIFLRDAQIQAMGDTYLKILALCQLASCLEAVGGGFFRGTGRTIPPSVASISSNAIRVPLCYALAATSLGLLGIWWGMTLSTILRGAWIFSWSIYGLRKTPVRDCIESVQKI